MTTGGVVWLIILVAFVIPWVLGLMGRIVDGIGFAQSRREQARFEAWERERLGDRLKKAGIR